MATSCLFVAQLELGGVVELGTLANGRRLAHVDLVTTHEETRRWSLAGNVGCFGWLRFGQPESALPLLLSPPAWCAPTALSAVLQIWGRKRG